MEDRKKKGRGKRAIALLLTLLLTLSPCLQGDLLAQAASFMLKMKGTSSMLMDVSFSFFGERMGSGIYYWEKSDGSPLFCVQQHARAGLDLNGTEAPEAFGEDIHFTPSQYELVSLILQCCGMRRGETGELEAGDYLAAQAAIWGVLSPNWLGVEQLEQEMENLHRHVRSWRGIPAQELIAQSSEMVEAICRSIEENYGDDSQYIPAFASKYEENAPVWQAQWQEDGSCQVVFERGDKSEAIKDFEFQLPTGWSYRWDGDQVIFSCQEPQDGVIEVTGSAPEGSELSEEAMPIGLIYVVWATDRPEFQHLTSGVDVTIPLCCYLKIYTPPQEQGSWYLPGGEVYRHQEDLTALYGVELEKTDGDTGDPLEGVEFQILEYFDARQLEGTILDKEQLETWDGWKARCEKQLTGSGGRLEHWDKKTYHFEKTYCGGHPDPVIVYEGNVRHVREQLEEEAWEAWEEAVEACAELCDYHTTDGSGSAQLQADRDLVYEQFTSLAYGYTFEELEPLEGYLPYRADPEQEARQIFCVSAQAGGECREGSGEEEPGVQLARSARILDRVMMAGMGTWDGGMDERSSSERPPSEEPEGHALSDEPKEKGATDGRVGDTLPEGQGGKPSPKDPGGQVRPASPEGSGASNEQIEMPALEDREEKGQPEGKGKEDPSEGQGKEGPSESQGEKRPPEGQDSLDGREGDILSDGREGDIPSDGREGDIPSDGKEGDIPSDGLEGDIPSGGREGDTPPDGQEGMLPPDGADDLEAEEPPNTAGDQENGAGSDPSGEHGIEDTPAESDGQEEIISSDGQKEPEGGWPSNAEGDLFAEETIATRSDAALAEADGDDEIEEGEEEALTRRQLRRTSRSPIWLTSQVEPMEQVHMELTPAYLFQVRNYRIDPPEESKPEEPQPTPPPPDRPHRSGRTEGPPPEPAMTVSDPPVPLVGWIEAAYTPPAALTIGDGDTPMAGRSKTGEGGGGFPETGDRGMDPAGLLFIMAGAALGIAGLRRKKKQMLLCLLLPLFSAAAVIEVRAEAPQQLQEAEEPQEPEEELVLYLPVGEDDAPQECYVDGQGQGYILYFFRQVEEEIPEETRRIEETRTYTGLESTGQIPETLEVEQQDEEDGRIGTGQLRQTESVEIGSYWVDDLQIPVIFHSYDADQFELQGMTIAKEEALDYLLEEQETFLADLGCEPGRYEIREIVWDGESYMDQGILCRRAWAMGRKRLTDHQVSYEGTVFYPAVTEKKWEARYHPVPSPVQDTEEGEDLKPETQRLPEEPVPEAVVSETPPAVQGDLWKAVRTFAAYTVSIAVLLPVFFFLAALWKKRKQWVRCRDAGRHA